MCLKGAGGMDVSFLLREVEEGRQNAWRSYLFCGLMGIAPVVMLLFRKTAAALVVLGLWLLYYLVLVRQDGKKYAAAFLRGNLLASLSPLVEGVEYHGKAGIPREELLADRLLPIREGNSCITFHRVTGKYGGRALELCDVSFQLAEPDEQNRPRFFSGCWVRIRLERPTGRQLRLVSGDLALPSSLTPWYGAEGLTPAPLGQERAGRVFSSWRREGTPGLGETVPDLAAGLWEERELPLAMGLEEDRLVFFLPRRFLAPGEPPVRFPVSQSVLCQSPLPELEGILKVAAACEKLAEKTS